MEGLTIRLSTGIVNKNKLGMSTLLQAVPSAYTVGDLINTGDEPKLDFCHLEFLRMMMMPVSATTSMELIRKYETISESRSQTASVACHDGLRAMPCLVHRHCRQPIDPTMYHLSPNS